MRKQIFIILFIVSIVLPRLAQCQSMPDFDNENIETVEELDSPILDNEYDSSANYDEEPNNDEYENDEAYEVDEEVVVPWDLRQVDRNKWAKTKKEKRFIYKKQKPEKETIQKEVKPHKKISNPFNSDFFKMLLYILFAAFLAYIIYLFLKNNDISFRRNIKDESIVQEDPWEDVRSFEDWELALQKALAAQDYRLATRIYYLQTLNIMDRNGVVRYREDKTNWYYVNKLFGGKHHDTFKDLTMSFDYIWYGEYEITNTQFEVLQSQFKNFHVQIM